MITVERHSLILLIFGVLCTSGCTITSSISKLSSISQNPTAPSPLVPTSNPPTNLSYAPMSQIGYDGFAISNLTPAVTGSVTSYTISPSLPAGLTLNSTTGIISGTPVGVSASAAYTITASNADGSTTAVVTIVIGPNFSVTSTGSGGDSNAGDGACNNGLGQCTLRAAVEEANAGTLPAKIVLPDGTYNLGGSELSISAKTNVSGTTQAGTIINAGGTSRAINSTSMDLSLSKLTIQNGFGGSTATSQGGGIMQVMAGSALALDQVTMTGNQSDASSQGGGAVYFKNGAKLTVTNSTFTSNSQTQGSGSFLGGGAIYADGIQAGTISFSNFTGNSAASSGGAIFVSTMSNLTISDSTFDSNTNTGIFGGGGAIYSASGPTLYRNLFKNNQVSGGNGGGLYVAQSSGGNIENCTFYGNGASANLGVGGIGGAIYVGWAITFGSQFSNNTIVANSASASAGGYYCANSTVPDSFRNNIFSANSNGNCAFQTGAGNSQGSNIDSGNSCGFASTGDLINTDPLVVAGAPANNGGPTLSIALQAGSPARDAGAAAGCPTVDQRGTSRPNNGQCDIGAYEY